MHYQIDTRSHRSEEVRVGQDERELAVFRRAGFFVHHLEADVEGATHHLKLPAPWSGFRFRLLRGSQELASAKKKRRMHAFDRERPLHRNLLVEFELEVGDRPYLLVPADRHGEVYELLEGETARGRLVQRGFEAQEGGAWEADLETPPEWTLPLAAFVAFLARDGRRGMGI